MHWVPLAPFVENDVVHPVGKVRVGGKDGEVLENATLTGSLLTGIKESSAGTTKATPVTVDLRLRKAETAEFNGSVAIAVTVPLALVGLAGLTFFIVSIVALGRSPLAAGTR